MLVVAKEIATNIKGKAADSPDGLDGYVERLMQGEAVDGLWLLTVSEEDGRMFVLLSAREARKPYYEVQRMKVVGMAFGERQAQLLLADMLRKWMAQGESVLTWKRHCLDLEERV